MGGHLKGDLNAEGFKIVGLPTPGTGNAAATKTYVDTAVAAGTGAVASVNGQTGVVVLDAADVGARAASDLITVDDIDATGDPDITTYLRGDGSWSTPPGDGGGGGGDVASVNGQTGVVVLDAADVGALADDVTLDDIAAGTTNKPFTSTEKTKLAGIDSGSQANTVFSVAGKTGTITLVANDISNASTVGKNVLVSADAAAARSAIGAGTSSFDGVYASLTSKPTLGGLASQDIINDGTFATVSTTRPMSATATKTYIDAQIALLAAKIGGVQFCRWSGTTWNAWDGDSWDGAVSTSSALIRIYISLNDDDADAPTYYNTDDMWFAHPLQAGVS